MKHKLTRMLAGGLLIGLLFGCGLRAAYVFSDTNRPDVAVLQHPPQLIVDVPPDSSVGNIEVPITNAGKRRLVVHWAIEDCCQRLSPTRTLKIPPGQTRLIRTRIDLVGWKPSLGTQLLVFSNDPALPTSVIPIHVSNARARLSPDGDELTPVPEGP